MFQRFHALRERREGGFTLIELLVVILIIAILAAIAIPVFLNQRRKGWESAAKSALKDAATAQESYRTSNTEYAEGATAFATDGDLETEGYNPTADVNMAVDGATTDADQYCMTADNTNIAGGVDFYFDSDVGDPRPGNATDCT